MTLKVSLDALHADSVLWSEVAGKLSTASGAAWGQWLSAHEFTGVADREGLVALYQECLTKVANLVSEGSTSGADISKTLTSVRNQYLDDEAKARAKFAGVWDPK